ncbi:aminopeptidase N [Sarotherodon galilaeus]
MPNKLRSAREEPESSLKPRTASPVTPFLSKWISGAEQAGPEICRFSQANRAYRDEAKETHTLASLHNVQAKEMKWSSGAEQAGPEICRFSQANRAYRDEAKETHTLASLHNVQAKEMKVCQAQGQKAASSRERPLQSPLSCQSGALEQSRRGLRSAASAKQTGPTMTR